MNALAGDIHLRPLWKAVHDRLSRGDATERSKITVPDASPEVRVAVDRLIGRVSSLAK